MLEYGGSWKDKAKCFNDPIIQAKLRNRIDPFFDKPEAANGRWAKDYCSDCQVRLACLAEAMKTLEGSELQRHQGIWGGMTLRQRIKIQKRQQKEIREIAARLKELFPDTEDPIAS